jgi:hypothetical protein
MVTKYFTFELVPLRELSDPLTWTRMWQFTVPRYKNWYRLVVFTPLFSFHISGWLFWGRKPTT